MLEAIILLFLIAKHHHGLYDTKVLGVLLNVLSLIRIAKEFEEDFQQCHSLVDLPT